MVGRVLRYVNPCSLFNAKPCLYIDRKLADRSRGSFSPRLWSRAGLWKGINGRLQAVRPPGFAWATFEWVSCIIDSFGQAWLISLTKWSMSNIDQQGSNLDSYPTFPTPNPHFNRPSGHWPCVKPCLAKKFSSTQTPS